MLTLAFENTHGRTVNSIRIREGIVKPVQIHIYNSYISSAAEEKNTTEVD